MRELATDLVKKAKEIDALIEVLPGIDQTEDEQVTYIHIDSRVIYVFLIVISKNRLIF